MKKPTDRDHDEGMGGKGLGIACEKSRGGGDKMKNICSVYLLRSRMHDHNPAAVPPAFCAPFYRSCLPSSSCFSFICFCVFFPLSLSSPLLCHPLSYNNMVSMALSQMLKSFKIGRRFHMRLYITAMCWI